MAFFLLKTEPSVYSYDDLERDKKTTWDGVANTVALKHIREAKKGDLAVVYHTGGEKQAVGVAELTSDPYPDPKQADPRLAVFDLKARKRLARSVTLDDLKSRQEFSDSPLIRIGRLSVIPLTEKQWRTLLAMAETKLS